MSYELIKWKLGVFNSEFTQEEFDQIKDYYATLDKESLVTELWFILDHNNVKNTSIKEFLIKNYRTELEEMQKENRKTL